MLQSNTLLDLLLLVVVVVVVLDVRGFSPRAVLRILRSGHRGYPFDGPEGMLMAKYVKVRACSHIVHQMQTPRGAKSGTIIILDKRRGEWFHYMSNNVSLYMQ